MSSTEAEAEAESEEEGADEKMCCAGCGKAEVDEIKLRKCTDCDLVDIAAYNARGIIGCKTKELARKERPNYVTSCSSSNPKAATLGTVLSVVYHNLFIWRNH